ncbi:phage tail tape measure protein [Sanguibacter sp. HDW7]|uniref:phage tail tape measure protein n=1 Tax=Sanguibacter sp. HDW7 TaxID=2714931 RepID=UPI00140D6322|nr:phage tail tape measure protein [Sanguibacter sp. HDW7]QIK82984.1 phage tail tape measure protein [Sanguibacter sp. HDW7]
MSLTVGELVAYIKVDDQDSARKLDGVAQGMGKVQAAADKAARAGESLVAAQHAVARSADAVAKAEKALADARKSGDQEKVAAAEKSLQQARERQAVSASKLERAERNVRSATEASAAATEASAEASKKATIASRLQSEAAQDLANRTALVGGALTAAAGIAVKFFADFDEGMSGVAATGDDARQNIDGLRASAIQAGADTKYSATEAAGGIEELAKSGVTAKDVLAGGLKGSLDLAAAGNLGVAEAAEYAAIAMTQFKLKGSDVGHVADLLAAGAGKAMGEVSDLGQALKQGGLVASATGLSIEETTAALAAFAAGGLLGSDAGTSLKTMLQRLSAPMGDAKQLMDSLGISAYDVSGQWVGLEQLAGQLTNALGDMTPAQRNAAMATMFGADAVRAANALYENGADGVREWTAAVNDQGYASEVAAIRMDNLKGDLETLSGSIETVFIQAGGGANDVLREMAQGAGALVDAIGEVPGPVLEVLTVLTGAGGMTALGVAGLTKLVGGLKNAKNAAEGLKLSAKGASVAVGAVSAAIGVATIGVMAWANAQAESKQRIDSLRESLDGVTGAVTESTRQVIAAELVKTPDWWTFDFSGSAAEGAEALGISVETVTNAILGQKDAMAALERYYGPQEVAYGNIREEAEKNGLSIGDYNDAVGALRRGLQGQSKDLDAAKKKHELMAEATGATSEETDRAAKSVELFATNLEDQAKAADAAWKAIKGLADGVLGMRDAERGYEAALDAVNESLKKNGQTLDVGTEKGRANQAVLDGIADAGWKWIDQMRAQGATDEQLQKKMGRTRREFVDAAKQMGLSEKAAKKLADELGLIPSNIKTEVDVDTSKASAEVTRFIREQMKRQIAINVVTNSGGGGKTHVQAKATGGAVVGPGTGTSDDILARLSNGEHVITAREVAAMGGHAQVTKWRAAALAGRALPAFAAGGRVGANDPVVDATAAVKRARSAVKREERQVESALNRWRDIPGDKKNRDRKRTAQRQLDDERKDLKAAKAALKNAEKALDDARKERAEEREKQSRLSDARADLAVDARRGNITDQVSSGLSGAYSVVDTLRDQSKNSDLSKAQRANLAKTAREAEVALRKLYAQAEGIEKKLDTARDHTQQLASIKASVAGVLAGEFKLSDSLGKKDAYGYDQPVTAKGLLASAQKKAGDLKTFGGKLDKLAAAGVAGVILQEIAHEGLEGGTALADALLADPSTIKALNGAYADIDRYSQAAGASATKNTTIDGRFYRGGVEAAEAIVDGLEDQLGSVTASIEAWGVTMENALLASLGLKRDSKGNIVKASANSSPIAVGPDPGASGDIRAPRTVAVGPDPGASGDIRAPRAVTAQDVAARGGDGRAGGLRRTALNGNLPGLRNGGPVAANMPVAAPINAPTPAPVYVTIPDIYVRNPITGEDVKVLTRQVVRAEMRTPTTAMAVTRLGQNELRRVGEN